MTELDLKTAIPITEKDDGTVDTDVSLELQSAMPLDLASASKTWAIMSGDESDVDTFNKGLETAKARFNDLKEALPEAFDQVFTKPVKDIFGLETKVVFPQIAFIDFVKGVLGSGDIKINKWSDAFTKFPLKEGLKSAVTGEAPNLAESLVKNFHITNPYVADIMAGTATAFEWEAYFGTLTKMGELAPKSVDALRSSYYGATTNLKNRVIDTIREGYKFQNPAWPEDIIEKNSLDFFRKLSGEGVDGFKVNTENPFSLMRSVNDIRKGFGLDPITPQVLYSDLTGFGAVFNAKEVKIAKDIIDGAKLKLPKDTMKKLAPLGLKGIEAAKYIVSQPSPTAKGGEITEVGNTISLSLGTPLKAGEGIPKGHIGNISVEKLPDEKGFVELKGIRTEQRGEGNGEKLLLNALTELDKRGISGIKSIKFSAYENAEGRSENATKMFERIMKDKNNPITVTKIGDDYYAKLSPKEGGGIEAYHGTSETFDTFSNDMRGSITGAKSAKGAIWFTNDPDVAKAYSVYAAESGPITKILAEADKAERKAQKSGKQEDWDKHDELLRQVEELDKYEATLKRREKANVKKVTLNGDFYEVDAQGKTPQELSADNDIDSWLNEQLKIAKKLGKDGVVFKNLDDAVGLYNRPATHYAIFDSKNISKLSPKEGGVEAPPSKPPKPPVEEPPTMPEGEGKERKFVGSIKDEMPVLKVAGQYIPRSTDELAQKARTLIQEDLPTAQKMAAQGTDDASIATGAELLKYYVNEAEKLTGIAKDALYEMATNLGNSMAERLTELGRSVQAASILARLTPEGQVRFAAKTIQKYNEKMIEAGKLNKVIPELTPKQAEEIVTTMKEIQGMPEGDKKAIAFRDLQNKISDLVPTSLMDKLTTVWKAGLLTGLKTTGVNVFANISHGATEAMKDIPATLIDMATSVITGERTVAFTTQGYLKGAKEGAEKGWRFLKTGYDERNVLSKYDYKRVKIGDSKLAKGVQKYEEFVFKLLGAEDQPFYYGAKMRSLYEQAKVEAINKGLKGDEAKAFIESLVIAPTDDMLLLAVNDAQIAVFQNETALGKIAKGIQNLPTGAAEFILPFGKTPSSVAMQIVNYSPVGSLLTVARNMGKDNFDQRDFSKGLGRAATGTALLGLGVWLYKQGMVNLDRPKGEAEQKRWEAEGRTPNTIKVGGAYRQIQSLGPVGNVLLVGAQFAKAFEESGSVTESFAKGAFGAIKSFTEQTFLQSVNMAMEAVSDPEKGAASFINSFVGSWVPTIVKDVAEGTDKKARRAESPIQKIIERMPILRYILEPRVGVFGTDIDRANNFIEVMIDPTRPSRIKNDPVVNEIRRLVTAKQEINTTQLGGKYGYRSLSQKQNTDMWKQSGRVAHEQLTQLMQYDSYSAMPDERKAQRVNKIINDAKETAKLNIVMERTQGLDGEQLTNTLRAMKKDGLLTAEIFKKLMRLR